MDEDYGGDGTSGTSSNVGTKAVWMLQRGDPLLDPVEEGTAPQWTKISDGDAHTRWSTPICHSAGGGDNVLLVEEGWLVTKALSRWKRGPDGLPCSKRLRPVQGQVQFLAAPDASKVHLYARCMNSLITIIYR
jgi:hypothetical protein